jgi:uncharacterized protein (DUF736 family)
MSDYDNTNSGVLFLNKTKESERHPDFGGTININGVDHFLSAWKKTSQSSGDKFLSLSIGKAKDKQSNTGGENKSAPVSPEGDDIW